MTAPLTEAEVVRLVRRLAKEETHRGLAQRLKVHHNYVQAVVSGRAKPGPKLLKGLRLRRETRYHAL